MLKTVTLIKLQILPYYYNVTRFERVRYLITLLEITMWQGLDDATHLG